MAGRTRLKGKQKAKAAVEQELPRPHPSDTDDIISSSISTLTLEPAEDILEDDERILEIATIAVIYPEFSKIGRLGGSIDIEISPSAPVTTNFTLLDGEGVARKDTAELSHLPPLIFEFQLPKGYPYEKPPNVRLRSSWLENDVISRLKSDLVEAWDGLRDQAIFNCIDILQSAADRLFDLPTPLDIRVIQKKKIEVLEFDRAMKVKKFNDGTFDCGVCLEPRKGAVCHKINQCGHVFCKSCLKDYFTAMITEGDVGSVQCLNYVCGKDLPPDEVVDEEGVVHKIPKKPGAIAPAELQLLVEPAMVQRYLTLKRRRAFEALKNVVYCPRTFCRGPALRDGEDSLAVCQDCSLAFCAECGKTWHGYKFYCKAGPAEPKTVEEEKEQILTKAFLESTCTPCPTCLIPISKTGGCNHMHCSRCWTHFCLLCGAFLFPDNPYIHFSKKESSCYNRLFEGVDEDGNVIAPVEPPPPPPEEPPPQPMMIQIVVPGQGPRDIVPAPAPVVEPEPEEALNEAAVVEGPENNNAPQQARVMMARTADDLEDDVPPTYLTEDEECEFWVLCGRNECFREGYNMLDEELDLKEIADFIRDWAISINEGRRNKIGLGAYWRRLIEWRRGVRDPRLRKMEIDLSEYKFTPEARRAARQLWLREERDLIRRWWEIWHGGMRELGANREWDEDEMAEAALQDALEFVNGQPGSSRAP